MKHVSKFVSAATLLTMLTLAGCSGGSDGNDSGPGNPGGGNQNQSSTEVPDSASVSTAAFIAFMKSLATDDETSEPLTFREGWASPASETDDAEPLG